MTEPTTTRAVWVDGDPLMETIAAAIWEHCGTEGTSIVRDDPRNIAAVVASVMPPADAPRSALSAPHTAEHPAPGPERHPGGENGPHTGTQRADGERRQRYARALRTTPATGHTHKPGQEKWDHHPAPGSEGGHRYTYTCALCRGDIDALATAVLAVAGAEQAELRQRLAKAGRAANLLADSHRRAERAEAALERVQQVVRRLAAHAAGFQDVLDDSDRGPWGSTIGADITELRDLAAAARPDATTGDQAAEECPGWPECPTLGSCPGCTPSPHPDTEERHQRYVAAIVAGGSCVDLAAATRAVLAVADAEQAELRAAVLREAIDVAREEGHRLEEAAGIESARGARSVAYLLRRRLVKAQRAAPQAGDDTTGATP